MKKIDWSEDAPADVRRIDRKMAMRIFTTIQRFAETGELLGAGAPIAALLFVKSKPASQDERLP